MIEALVRRDSMREGTDTVELAPSLLLIPDLSRSPNHQRKRALRHGAFTSKSAFPNQIFLGGNPAALVRLRRQARGFASPPYDGFALVTLNCHGTTAKNTSIISSALTALNSIKVLGRHSVAPTVCEGVGGALGALLLGRQPSLN
jgi:hypothetical protein